MRVKFQADADLNEDIVSGVLRRVPEIDFKTATEAGLEGIVDEKVLLLASLDERVLVTHDRRTMPTHFAKFIEDRHCPGVLIVSKKMEISAVISELLLIWTIADADEFANSIRFLPL